MVRYVLADDGSAKYAFLAYELFVSGVSTVLDRCFHDTALLQQLFAVLKRQHIEETAAGYFAGVAGTLLGWKPEALLQFLFVDNDYCEEIVRHIGRRSIAELVASLVKCEYGGSQFAIEKMRILELVVSTLCESHCPATLSHSRLVLSEAIETATDLKGWKIYMALLLQSPCVRLLTNSLASSDPAVVSVVADVLTALLTLEDFDDVYDYPFADVKRPSRNNAPCQQQTVFDVFELLDAKVPHIAKVLRNIGESTGKTTGIGTLGVSLVKLLSAIVENSTPKLERSIVSNAVFPTVFQLFSQHHWASFFHLAFQGLVTSVLESCSSGLKYDLIVTADLPSLLHLTAKKPSCELVPGKNVRKGSLGSVTTIGNELLRAANSQPFVEGCLERSEAWGLFASEVLACRTAIERRKLGEEDPPTAPETPSYTAFSQSLGEKEADGQSGQGEFEEFYAGWYWKVPAIKCGELADLE